MRMVTDFLVRFRWCFFGCAFALALAAVPLARQVSFDRSIENMFSEDAELLRTYRKLKRTFGGNEIVLAVYTDPGLLDPSGAGVRRLATISQRCEDVAGVSAVLSLDRLMGEQVVVPDDALAERTRGLFENYTHSTDGSTAAVICMLAPQETATVSRDATISSLRRVMESLPDGLLPGVLAGEPVMVAEGFRYLEQDGRRLGLWSTVLLSVAILAAFRGLRWVVVPVLVVQWTLLMTRAALVASGLRLSMVSSMLTAIVTVVGVATVVHVIVRFRGHRAAGLAPPEALRRAAATVAAPVFWACATDAVGFFSLTVSSVGPVQDFGVMMAIGSLFVVPAVALLVPALVLWRDSGGPFAITRGEQQIGRRLERALAGVVRHRRAFLVVLTLAALGTSAGAIRLEIETDFTSNFRSGSSVVQAYRLVENRLGGAGLLDILLPAPARLDAEYLDRVRQLEAELRTEFAATPRDGAPQGRLTKVLSLADAVGEAGPIDSALVPRRLRDELINLALATFRHQVPEFAAAMYGEDPENAGVHYLRVMLRAPERQRSAEKLKLIQDVQRISRRHFPARPGGPESEVTGFFVLLANLVESVLRDQWLAFAVALAGIGLMMWFAFGSWRLALIALFPNALPILLVLGGMGWLGGRVNMGVAMIAAVSLGLSVDSSIHYVTFFRRAREAGKSVMLSIAEVQQTVGRAVVFSTLALMIGFTVLCTSNFVPTIYFGLLVSISMLGGLLGNVLLLPLLLILLAGGVAPQPSGR